MATREERTLLLEVISATDLKKVKTFGKQDAFATAYVYPQDKHSTKVDTVGGLNPVWNSKLTLKVDEYLVQQEHAAMTLEIHCKSTFGSKMVGATRIPLSNLPKENAAPQFLAFELRRKSGKTQGRVNVSLALGEKKTVPVYQPQAMRAGAGSSQVPVMGYPAGRQGYYPQQQPYGYPQQQPYGYAQQPYGYPQQGYGYQQQPPRRAGMGGAGLGLGAGLLGGLLVGDALGDMGDGGGDFGGGDFGGGDFGGGF